MNFRFLLKILLFLSISILIYAQQDIQIGSPNANQTTNGGLYDFSDPNIVNIKVQLWGYVKFPGFYIIPAGTSLNEIISLGGGPLEDATLDDIRIVKMKEGTPTVMRKYNYNDLVWENTISNQAKYIKLDAGDIIVVPGNPRYFTREDITFYTGLLTSLASIAALVVSIIILTKQ